MRAATLRALLALSAFVSSFLIAFALPAVAQAAPPDSQTGAAGDGQASGTTAPAAASAGPAGDTTQNPPPSASPAQPQADASSAASQASAPQPAPAPAPDPAPASSPAGGSGNGNGASSANGNGNGHSSAQPNAQSTPPGQQPGGNAASNGNDANANANGANGNGNANGQTANHSGNANGSASSTQDNPQNVNVNVRVDQPCSGDPSNAHCRDNGPVRQSNDSSASALGGAGSSTTQGTTTATAAAPGTPTDAAPASGVCTSGGDPTQGSAAPAASGDAATSGTSPQSTGDCVGNGGAALPTAGGDATTIDIAIPPDASGAVVVGAGDPSRDTANSGPTPTVGSAPSSSSSADSASANATSTQVQPTNLNLSVRVLSPGDNGPVDQRNTSTATAVAAGNPPVGAGDGTAPSATSTSTQVAPANLNVSVRVGSPGKDEPRTQLNSSSATSVLADPATVAPALGTLPDPNNANSASQVDNESSIVQGLAQCGDTCPDASTQPGTVAATSPAQGNGTANATAIQQSPTNVDVSVRVASSGDDGQATQVNSASANGAATVSTTTTPNNIVVSVAVEGGPNQVKAPAGDAPWAWNWTWTTGQAPVDPNAAGTSSSTWEWTWTAPLDPAPETTTTAAKPQSGTWTWTWTWTRPDGTTTTWTYGQACSCSWAWSWTWNWPASTTSNASAAPPATAVAPPPSDPTVSQQNESSATAVALTTFTGSQSAAVTSDGTAAGTASSDQGIASQQDSQAAADVVQTRPVNQSVVTAGEIEGVDQQNTVAATAVATTYDESTPAVNQSQLATDDGASHSLDAVQRIETLQSADAGVSAAQTDATNINRVWSAFGPSTATLGKVTQLNQAATLTIADAESAVRQVIDQGQTGGGADQTATATQVALTSQAQTASSRVAQSRVTNLNDVSIPLNGISNPPVVQSNSVSAVSTSYAGSEIDQSIAQSESGDGIEWHATATQVATVEQSGTASSAASQSDRTNTAGWNGETASPGVSTTSGTPTGLSASPLTFIAYASSAAFSRPGGGPPHRPVNATRPTVRIVVVRHKAAVPHVEILRLGITNSPASAGAGLRLATFDNSSSARGSGNRPSGTAGRSSSPPLPAKHDFNLIGTMSTAPPALLSAGFAALLEPIRLAAPGVGRLQRDAPALGQPVDTALRERPG